LQQGIETLVVPVCNKILTACLACYVPKIWKKVRNIYDTEPGRSSYDQIIQTHQFDIFPLENDEKAGGSSYKGRNIKGLSLELRAARIPEGKIN
jgi:hypothetical protein